MPRLFSDDTNTFIFHKTKDALFKLANEERDFLVWLLANKLSLDINSFTPNKNEKRDNLPNLRLLDHNLPQTDYEKYLGVLLNDCLTFKIT